MLRIANEERPWMELFPTQGATYCELTLSMQQYPKAQQGTYYLPYIIILELQEKWDCRTMLAALV